MKINSCCWLIQFKSDDTSHDVINICSLTVIQSRIIRQDFLTQKSEFLFLENCIINSVLMWYRVNYTNCVYVQICLSVSFTWTTEREREREKEICSLPCITAVVRILFLLFLPLLVKQIIDWRWWVIDSFFYSMLYYIKTKPKKVDIEKKKRNISGQVEQTAMNVYVHVQVLCNHVMIYSFL